MKVQLEEKISRTAAFYDELHAHALLGTEIKSVVEGEASFKRQIRKERPIERSTGNISSLQTRVSRMFFFGLYELVPAGCVQSNVTWNDLYECTAFEVFIKCRH